MSISMLSQGIGLFTANINVGKFFLTDDGTNNFGETVNDINILVSIIDKVVNIVLPPFQIVCSNDSVEICINTVNLPSTICPSNTIFFTTYYTVDNGNIFTLNTTISPNGQIKLFTILINNTETFNFGTDDNYSTTISYIV